MSTLPTELNAPVTEDQLVNMSDEEINELDFSSFEQETVVASEEAAAVEEEADEHDEGDEATDADEPELDDEPGEEAASTDDDPVLEDGEPEADPVTTDEEAAKADPEPATTDAPEVDYKAEYEKLFAPFNANGKQIKIDSADDAIQLMQMGANYAKKMAALKPNLKLLKMLENNQLLSEEKLNYYIDLEKKNPEAIKRFIKESGVDPLDLDLNGNDDYKPGNHTVDDRAIDLDMVLDELKDSPTYAKTLSVVSGKWDAASKQSIYDNPQVLKVINGHIENGMYDLISSEVERERMLGRLAGVSDLEAYRQAGDAIYARGGFNHLIKAPDQAPADQGQPKSVIKTATKPKAATDQKRNQQRRAASPTTRSSPATSGAGDYNPLSLSDDEFEKLSGLPI